MNTDQAKQLADNALTQLIEALEQGQSETLLNSGDDDRQVEGI